MYLTLSLSMHRVLLPEGRGPPEATTVVAEYYRKTWNQSWVFSVHVLTFHFAFWSSQETLCIHRRPRQPSRPHLETECPKICLRTNYLTCLGNIYLTCLGNISNLGNLGLAGIRLAGIHGLSRAVTQLITTIATRNKMGVLAYMTISNGEKV